jgi:hypothetical protein
MGDGRGIGELWHPMPARYMAEASRGDPAGIVGWSYVWRHLEAGDCPPIRQVAEVMGRGKWKAEQVRSECIAAYELWSGTEVTGKNRTTTGQRPDKRRTDDVHAAHIVEASPDNDRTSTGQAPDTHGRDLLLTVQVTTTDPPPPQRGEAPPPEAAKDPAPKVEPTTDAEPTPTPEANPTRQVWDSWREAYEDFRQRAPQWNLPAVRRPGPNRAEQRAIGGRLGEGATVEECRQVVAWALRDGTDDYARYLRGEHSFDSLKPAAPYPDVETLFKPKGWEKRRRLALSGPHGAAGDAHVDPEAEAQRAWGELPRLFRRPECRRNPSTWPPEVFGAQPEVQTAFRRALLEHGGADMASDDFTRRRFVASFVTHFRQARAAS